MNQLKISTRILLMLSVLAALLLFVGLLGLYGMSQSNDRMRSIYEDRAVPLKQLGDINYLANRNRILVMDMMLTLGREGDQAHLDKRHSEVQKNQEQILAIWKAYKATRMTPEETQLAADMEKLGLAYTAEALLPTAKILATRDLSSGSGMYEGRISPQAPAFQKVINELMELQNRIAAEEYQAATASYKLDRALSIGAIVLGLAAASLLGWLLQQGIRNSLKEAKAAAHAVATGDLTHRIQVLGNDEIAELLRELVAMQASLSDVVLRVRQGAESVSTASTEIAQGNQDLSSRTESQASALEETAASMEQLSSTVQQNADNARQANQLANNASSVAIQGGEVVGQVVETMKGISESSRQIAEIINVIDGIAFQTNILALNAAVEAARAGEQGRGFAVVAGEVRNLAQRSSEAAKEIKHLITDSVSRVEQGTGQVDRAGATMNEIVTSIRRVSDIVAEISAASTEQSAGVSQVGEAVMQLDQTTQQNAAMVEQMAAAASSLRSQAQDLVQTVAAFKVTGGAQSATLATPARATSRPSSASAATATAKPVTQVSARPTASARPAAPVVTKAPAALTPQPAQDTARPVSPTAPSDDDWTSF
ncbi:MAG: methyl-accepting chemotaxis protein [Aquabacterium sp.]|jgi:methyl-accepting chemotaxis protein-1 (serine sensor receptor)|uniref:methyl-accepting chemotaxis protein n=1 Tax=Aquabacterium sp. TaxID=1872578 RepID=UPI002A35E90E|nr:methyl-accepting chemotaxis protein [Aquabacterium sp.]MDX9844258.1 methyl-accepting chemotaxis protein [Aquabacterium sp.]